MFDLDHWKEIYATLAKNKLRTILTAFGVGWGVIMLIVMLAAGSGLRNGVMEGEFSGFAMNSLYIWTQNTTKPYKGLPSGRWFSLRNGDTEAIRANVPEIATLAPRNEVGGWRGAAEVRRKDKTGDFRIFGDVPEIRDIQSLNVPMGRWMNPKDIEEKRKVAIIGARVHQTLFSPGEDPIGEYIMLNSVAFKVVGVVKTVKTGEEANEDASSVWIPFSTFQQTFNYGDHVSYFGFAPKVGVATKVIEDKILTILKERHSIHPDDEFAFGTNNNEEDFKEVSQVFSGIDFISWLVGVATLLAGVIGVSNIMLVIIKERTKEIGIRRAIGASPFQIVRQIMLEALILTSTAGYVGVILGVLIVENLGPMIQDEAFKNPEINFHAAMLAVVVLSISGCLAGLLPAIRALEIKPVEALRTDG